MAETNVIRQMPPCGADDQAGDPPTEKLRSGQAACEATQYAARSAIARHEAKQAAGAAEKKRAEARFRCLSYWDGSMRDLVDVVTQKLRDPASFEHVQTFASAVKPGGQQYVTMQFRARNGFGGVNVSQAKATVQNESCTIVTWSMQ